MIDLSILDGKCLKYELVGSRITCDPAPIDTDQDYLAQVPMSFQSFTLGKLNLIITFDPEFYRRFLAATGMAKHLNLLSKDDRVMLFQAVLYGNEPFPTPAPMPEASPPKDYMRPWWVCSKGHGSGCVEAMNETEARAVALEKMGGEILACDQLPYPATPRIHIERPDFPSFCFEPHKCKGYFATGNPFLVGSTPQWEEKQ